MASATLKFQVTAEEKAEAERIAAELGLSTGAVMRVLTKRVVAGGSSADQLRVPAANIPSVDAATRIGLTTTQLAELSRQAGQNAAKQHLDAGRAITYAAADGTLVREYPDGRIESL